MIFAVSATPYLKVHGTSSQSVKKLVEELSNIGIGGVLVSCLDPERYPNQNTSTQCVINYAQQAGLRICAHAPAADISATDPAVRNQAVDSVQRAITNLGSSLSNVVITVHPENYAPFRQPGDDTARMECCHNSLETLAGTTAALGARIALENMRWRLDAPNRTGMIIDQLSEIVAELDATRVGLCFDTGHANISENGSLAGAFERNVSRIIHIHFHDNFGSDDLHLLPGKGNIDFRALFHTVEKSGYNDMVELEVAVPEQVDPLSFYKRNFQYFMHFIDQSF